MTTTYKLAFGSCLNAADSPAFAAAQALGPDGLYLAGDLWYADKASPTQSDYQTRWAALTTPATTNLAKLVTAVRAKDAGGVHVGWSDHDYGFGPNTGAGPLTATANSAYRAAFPTQILPSSGIYQTWIKGRVRFIQLDERSFKSPIGQQDDAAKTMLGATQKAWLKGLVAQTGYPLIVLLGDVPWVGAQTAGDDGWKGYATERDELRQSFQQSPNQIIRLSGDMHCLATGKDQFGLARVWQAAPFANETKVKASGEGYTQTWPRNGAEGPVGQQFAVVTFEDTETQVSATFRGYTADGQQRLADVITISASTDPVDPDPGGGTGNPGGGGAGTGDWVSRQEYDNLLATVGGLDGRVDALETWKASVENRLSTIETKLAALGQGSGGVDPDPDPDPGGGGTDPTTPSNGDYTTAAGRWGWGSPVFSETFADLSNWTLYSGEGHAGNGTREPGQISVSGNIMTIKGLAGSARSGGMALKGPVAQTRRRYGRYEIRARSYYTDYGPSGGTSTGGGTGGAARTAGVGGVAVPAGAVTDAGSSGTWTITSGGTASAYKVYDGGGRTVGRVDIKAQYVTLQNFKINANSQYGITVWDTDNVIVQNNDVKGVKATGDGDLNAMSIFGNNIKILYNTCIDYVSGSPGDSHTDAIQTWVSSSHPRASSNWEIIGNVFTGPANPSRSNSIPSIHQCIMAEGYGRGGNSGGNGGDPNNWVISDNTFGDSWNQCIKLDGVDNVTISRNKFQGSSDKIFEITDASSNVKIYSDNTFGSGYGSVGATVTSGNGPANPYATTGGGTTTPPSTAAPHLDGGYHPVALLWPMEGSVSSGQGEYDFMENGEPGDAYIGAFLHYPTSNGDGSQQIAVANYAPAGFDARAWHNIAIDWQPTGIKLYVDGNLWASHAAGASGSRLNIQDAQAMFLALQLDATKATGLLASTMQVQWVRVYSPTSTSTPATPGGGTGGGTGTVSIGPPKNLTGTMSGRVLTLNWQAPTIGTATQSLVDELLKVPGTKATIDMPTMSRVSGQLQDATLEYAVRAKDAAGTISRYSNKIRVVISGGVGTVTQVAAEGWDAGTAPSEGGDPGAEEPVDPGTGGTGTATYPADIVKDAAGKVKWYLTTPEWDPEAGDETWNIDPGGSPPLETFVRATNQKRSFKLNANKNGIIMSSDYEGSHTPNSTNSRMEFRERTAGNLNIQWTSSSGVHRCVVVSQCDRLDGNHMVMSQIHGGNEYNEDQTVFRLEGTTMWLTHGDTAHGFSADSNYALGTPVAMAFSVSASRVCSYYYVKLTTPALLASYIANPEQIYSTPVVHTFTIQADTKNYFKTGCYLQRKGAAGSWGQVTLYRAVCTHTGGVLN